MNSKKALEQIVINCKSTSEYDIAKDCLLIKDDLEIKENLEKFIKIILENEKISLIGKKDDYCIRLNNYSIKITNKQYNSFKKLLENIK